MRLLFLTDNFPPEVNAPASRTYEHCREWVKKGAEVVVITCAPNFPFGKTYANYKNKRYQTEVISGIKVIRVWSFMAPNKGFFLRTLDFMSFAFSSFWAGLFLKTDVVIATSPQFFTALSGRILSSIKRKPFVLEIRDLWPEQILVNTGMKRNALIKYFEWEAKKCYKKADLIVVVTDSYVKKIEDKGIDSNKIVVVKNGVDRSVFSPKPKNTHLEEEFDLQGKFVVGYIGTIGLSQNIPFIVDCISAFNKLPESANFKVHFLFVGEGAEKETAIRKSKEHQLKNVTFIGQVKKEEMPEYLSLIDISLVPLRKSNLFLSVIPSKLFELGAMEIPVLLGVEGEAKKLIERFHSGTSYLPEDKESFLKQLLKMVENEQQLDDFKKGGRLLAKEYDRQKLALLLFQNIEPIVS